MRREGIIMPDKTYKIIEVVGVSEDSVQQAVRKVLQLCGEDRLAHEIAS